MSQVAQKLQRKLQKAFDSKFRKAHCIQVAAVDKEIARIHVVLDELQSEQDALYSLEDEMVSHLDLLVSLLEEGSLIWGIAADEVKESIAVLVKRGIIDKDMARTIRKEVSFLS